MVNHWFVTANSFTALTLPLILTIWPNHTVREAKKTSRKHIAIPYVAGVSEKRRRILSKLDIPVHFICKNTLRQRLVHPKNRTPHKLRGIVYAVQYSEECADLYIWETKQFHKRMAQHGSSCQDSSVHLHLNENGHSFEETTQTFWTERIDGLREV